MTQLTSTEKSQIKFHYSISGATLFKMAALNRVLDNVEYNSFELSRIQDAISSADSAYDETLLSGGTLTDVSEEDVKQDIVVTSELTSSTTTYGDRNKSVKKRLPYRERLSVYYKQVEDLSRLIGVWLW